MQACPTSQPPSHQRQTAEQEQRHDEMQIAYGESIFEDVSTRDGLRISIKAHAVRCVVDSNPTVRFPKLFYGELSN